MRKREEPRQPAQSLTLSEKPRTKAQNRMDQGREGAGSKSDPVQGARVFCKGLIMVVLREPVRTSLNRGPQGIPYL